VKPFIQLVADSERFAKRKPDICKKKDHTDTISKIFIAVIQVVVNIRKGKITLFADQVSAACLGVLYITSLLLSGDVSWPRLILQRAWG
jgi:hypothetical protein